MYGRVLSFLIRHFSNYYTLHRSDLAARAAPLDPPLQRCYKICQNKENNLLLYIWLYQELSKNENAICKLLREKNIDKT